MGHNGIINAIDYNYINDTIMSGSDDKSLKLWDSKNQRIVINK